VNPATGVAHVDGRRALMDDVYRPGAGGQATIKRGEIVACWVDTDYCDTFIQIAQRAHDVTRRQYSLYSHCIKYYFVLYARGINGICDHSLADSTLTGSRLDQVRSGPQWIVWCQVSTEWCRI